MPRKVVLISDTGIDGAFAIALAFFDPEIDVLALAATAGNVSADQATRNIHILFEHLDPPRWPRLGEALAVDYDSDGKHLHSGNGFGGVNFQCAKLHHLHPADKLIVDEVQQHPGEVTVISLGPLTTLARAIDRDPQLPRKVRQLIIVGGAWNEPGNAGPVSEFHFYCDPASAQFVLRSGAPLFMIPLDVMRRVLFAPTDLMALTAGSTPVCRFLSQIAPHGIHASAQHYGIEGFYLKDVLGICAVTIPEAFKVKAMAVDVETKGDLTRGMSVIDLRTHRTAAANVDLATDVDTHAVRTYMKRILQPQAHEEQP